MQTDKTTRSCSSSVQTDARPLRQRHTPVCGASIVFFYPSSPYFPWNLYHLYKQLLLFSFFPIFKFFEIKDKTLQGRNEKNTQITLHHRRLQSLNAMLTLVKERKKRFKFFAFWLRERKYLSTICYQEIRENIFTDEMNDNPRYTSLHTPVS